jgi:hypothetical protein
MKATDIEPPFTKPAPRRWVIISEMYAVDIMAWASGARNPFARAQASSV